MWLVGRVFVTGLLVVGGPGVWAARERDATTSHESSSEEARDAWHDQEATESLKSFFSINPPRQQGGRSQWAPSPWGRPAEPRPNLPWHTAPRTPPPTTRRPPKYSLRLSPFQGTYPFESEVRGESYHSRIRFHHLGSKAKLNHPPRGQTFGNWGFPKFSHDGRDSHSHEHRSQHTGTFSDNSQETGTSFHGPHEIGESLGTTGPSPSHSSSHYQQPVKEGTLETLPYPDDYPDTFPETGAPQPTHTHSDSHKNVQTTQQLPDPLHQLHDSSGREPSLEVNERTPPQDSQAPRPFLHPGNLEALLEGSQLKEAKGEGSTSLDYLNEDEAIDSEPPEEDQPDASHHLLDSSHHGPDAPVPTAARENAGPEDEVGFSSPVLPNDDFHDYVDPSVGHTSPRASSEGTGQPNRPQASEDLTPTTPDDYNPDYYDHLYDEFLDLYYDDPEQKQEQQQQENQQHQQQNQKHPHQQQNQQHPHQQQNQQHPHQQQSQQQNQQHPHQQQNQQHPHQQQNQQHPHQQQSQQHPHQQEQQHPQQHQQEDQHQQEHEEPPGPRFPPVLEVLQPAAKVPTIAASPPPPSLSSTPSATFLQSTTSTPSPPLGETSAPTSPLPPADTRTQTSPATIHITTSSTSPSDDKLTTAKTPTTISTTTTTTTSSTQQPTTTTSPPLTTTTTVSSTTTPTTTTTTSTTSTTTTSPTTTTTTPTTTTTTTPTTTTTTTRPQDITTEATTTTTAETRGKQREGSSRAGAGRARGRAISLSEILQGLGLGLPQFLVALKTHGLTLKDFTSKVQDQGLTQSQFRKVKGNLTTLISFLKEGEEEEEVVEEVKTSETEKEEEPETLNGEKQNEGRKPPSIPYWLTSKPPWPSTTTTTSTTITTPTTTTTTTTPAPSQPPKIFGFQPGGQSKFSEGQEAGDKSVSGGDTEEGGSGQQEAGSGEAKEGAPIPIKLDLASVMREKGLTASEILHDLGSLFTVADDGDDNKTAGAGKKTTPTSIAAPEEGDNTTTSTTPEPDSASPPTSTVSLKPYIPPRNPKRFRPRPYRPQGGLLDGGSGRQIVTNRHHTTTRSTLFPPYVPPSTTPYTHTDTQEADSSDTETRPSQRDKKNFNRYAFEDYHDDPPGPHITLNMTKSAIMAASVMGGAAMCVFLAILVVVMYRGRVRLRRTPLALGSDSSTSSTPPLYVPRMRASMGKGPRQTAGFWGTLKKRFDPYSNTSSLSVIS